MIDLPRQAVSYQEKARDARLEVLRMIHRAGTSHIASNFSVIDIATVLYENLNHDYQSDIDGFCEYEGLNSDKVVWSCGWKAATIYYFLVKCRALPTTALEKFPNEPYLGLAEPSVPGIHVAGGSMGHGLPIAVGLALAKKKSGEAGTIYCIMSDGEMNEGTTWESAAIAAHHKLDNLVVFVDCNKWQAMGKTEDILRLDLPKIFDAFGWHDKRIDGHDFNAIEYAILQRDSCTKEHPRVFICDTIKGKGISFMEDHLLYHYKHVTDDEYARAVAELT